MVRMMLGLAIVKDDFSEDMQDALRQGLADVAGVDRAVVRITSIEQVARSDASQRRHVLGAGGIQVGTELVVEDEDAGAAVATQMSSDNLKAQMNKVGFDVEVVHSAEVAIVKVSAPPQTTPPPHNPAPSTRTSVDVAFGTSKSSQLSHTTPTSSSTTSSAPPTTTPPPLSSLPTTAPATLPTPFYVRLKIGLRMAMQDLTSELRMRVKEAVAEAAAIDASAVRIVQMIDLSSRRSGLLLVLVIEVKAADGASALSIIGELTEDRIRNRMSEAGFSDIIVVEAASVSAADTPDIQLDDAPAPNQGILAGDPLQCLHTFTSYGEVE